MKASSIIFLLLFLKAFLLFSQQEEKNTLIEYRYYTETNKDSTYTKKVFLKKGLIRKSISFSKSKRGIQKIKNHYNYNSIGNILKKKSTYKYSKSKSRKTTFIENYKYDNNEKLLEFSNNYGWLYQYFNYNKLNKAERIEFTATKGSDAYKSVEKLTYFDNGLIKQSTKETHIKNKVTETVIENYNYDKNRNIIELKRSLSLPYPTFILGRKHKEEKYIYEYNSDGLWTKKKMIVNGKQVSLLKRTYAK